MGYGIVNKDAYVFLANDPGILLGMFYTLSAYGYADTKVCFARLSFRIMQLGLQDAAVSLHTGVTLQT